MKKQKVYDVMKLLYPTVSIIVSAYFRENIANIALKNYQDITKDAMTYCLPKIQKYMSESQFKQYGLQILELTINKEVDMLDKIKSLQESKKLPNTLTWYQTFLQTSAKGMQMAEGMAKSFGANTIIDAVNKYFLNTTQQMLLLPAWVMTLFLINRMVDHFKNYVPLPSDVLKQALVESLKSSYPDIDISKDKEDKIIALQRLVETELEEKFKEMLDSKGNNDQKNIGTELEDIKNRIGYLVQTLQADPKNVHSQIPHSKP